MAVGERESGTSRVTRDLGQNLSPTLTLTVSDGRCKCDVLEYERLCSSHVVYCIACSLYLYYDPIDIDRGVASEPQGETAVRPRPSRGVGRLRPQDSDTTVVHVLTIEMSK